jgi:metal-responsive CopG/Arc/MetJ family transcriptional regulator
MQRITTSLPDDLAAALVREARRRRISVSQLVREILGASLGKAPQERRLSFIGLGRSGYRSTAREIEAILATEWSGDRRR